MKKSVPEILIEAAATYEERNKVYGDTYKNFGSAMAAAFPNGLVVKTADDWNRVGLMVQIMGKVTRYAAQFENGGHLDSAHDACVYSAMLEELTREYPSDRN